MTILRYLKLQRSPLNSNARLERFSKGTDFFVLFFIWKGSALEHILYKAHFILTFVKCIYPGLNSIKALGVLSVYIPG
jgi:hypothetical protein